MNINKLLSSAALKKFGNNPKTTAATIANIKNNLIILNSIDVLNIEPSNFPYKLIKTELRDDNDFYVSDKKNILKNTHSKDGYVFLEKERKNV